MLLSLLLMNACKFCSNLLVSLQNSEPYKSSAFTFDPKTLSLVLVVSAVDHHIGLSIENACLAFPIRASVPVLSILALAFISATTIFTPLHGTWFKTICN